ncbi:ABC transporter permease [Aquabacter spiritensis]|uniref:ABC transporter permease n=1 Tax=Aquabacter spiritensis TaxID=933073 RepID=UPI001FE0841C|nr:iron ABC transporter permease [Aquabacter spiritensis]
MLLVAPALVAGFVLLPILALGIIAARGSGDLWPHLIAYVLPDAVSQTLILLAGVGLLSFFVAVPCAFLVATCEFPGRRLLDWALLLPLALPGYIVAYSYLDLLHPLGPVQGVLRFALGIASPRDFRLPDVRSVGGCIFVLSCVLYPYVYLSARASFLMQSAAALDVARSLGASRTRAALRIALPMARPAIVAGLTLVLLEVLGDIGASEFLGVRTLTVSIYATWVNRSNLPGAAQIALVMLALVLVLVAAERLARRRARYTTAAAGRPPARVCLRGGKAAGATLLCALPVLLGFVAPVWHLATAAAQRLEFSGLSPALLLEARNSALLAGGGTLVAIALGLVVTVGQRLSARPAASVLARIASLGYAVPGTVLAIGLLTPLAGFDNWVDAAARETFGVSTGLLISGSGGALVIAYAIRFLAIPIGGLEAGFTRMSPHLDMAARSLGATGASAVRRIHLPLLRPALATAALMVFVDGMKELPATLLLRPLGVETLATHIYGEAARGTYEDGALAALLVVLVGLVPVVILARISGAAFGATQSSSARRGEAQGAPTAVG